MSFWIIVSVVAFTLAGVLYIYQTRDRYTKLDDYLTARNQFGTLPATATILASIMGAWILFTPAEAGTWGGIAAFGGYAVSQAVAVMLFAYFGPRMRALAPKGSTLFEFIFYRYGRGMYAVVLVVGIFYMAVFLAAELTGIALAVNFVAGIPLLVTALLVGGGTLIYTTYGGIRASIFTDTLQTIIILPTLLIGFFATTHYIGGWGEVMTRVKNIDPTLLSMNHTAGLTFAAVLGIAVIAANMFNQGFWSRVYSCKDDGVIRRSFMLAGILVVPMMLIAGFFGLMAVAEGTLQQPSSALFEVVMNMTPAWVVSIIIILAVALAMSSVDTMINAIATAFTVDIARFRPDTETSRLQAYARVITAIICAITIFVAAQGFSVLYLFLLADLACSAAVFPTFYGFYSKRFSGWAGMVSIAAGIIAGIPFFPGPTEVADDSVLLVCFVLALGVSAVLSVVLEKTSKIELNWETLSSKVQDIRS